MKEIQALQLDKKTADFGIKQLQDDLGDSIPMLSEFSDFIGETVIRGKADFSNLSDSFKSMLIQMVSEAASRKIIMSFAGTAAGSAAGSAAAGAAGSAAGSADAAGGAAVGAFKASLTAAAVPLVALAAAFSFLKSKTKMLNSGLQMTASGMNLMTKEFETWQTKKYWGLSKKITTDYRSSSSASEFQKAYSQIHKNVTSLAKDLGIGADAFDSFHV